MILNRAEDDESSLGNWRQDVRRLPKARGDKDFDLVRESVVDDQDGE